MITFFAGNYDLDNLLAMRDAIHAARFDLPCLALFCSGCPRAIACADLARLERYIERKISTMEASANE